MLLYCQGEQTSIGAPERVNYSTDCILSHVWKGVSLIAYFLIVFIRSGFWGVVPVFFESMSWVGNCSLCVPIKPVETLYVVYK